MCKTVPGTHDQSGEQLDTASILMRRQSNMTQESDYEFHPNGHGEIQVSLRVCKGRM